jgi:hypothetical protein
MRGHSLQLSSAMAGVTVIVTALGGCGRRAVTPVPVKGRVTLNGTDWPRPGRLYFTSQPGGDRPTRPGFASFEADGSFAATTIHPGDGLLPGRYRVHVECWEVPPSMANPIGKSHVPPKYQNGATSGLELVVAASEMARQVNFDVSKEVAP